jgi:hypothetical protein
VTQLDATLHAPSGVDHNTDQGESVGWKCLREVELLGHGIFVGGVKEGASQIGDHPIEFVGGLVGAAAIAAAMKGPVWMKAPAIGLSVAGNGLFALHAFDCLRTAAPAFASTWQSGKEMDKNFAIADRSVGSLAFDGAVMAAAGWGTAKVVGKIPNSAAGARRAFSLKLGSLSDSMANGLGIGSGPEFAYATNGGGGYRGFEVSMPENFRPETIDLSRPMMMAASGTGGGGGSGEMNYRTWQQGTATVHEFNNVTTAGKTANNIRHSDSVVTTLGQGGNVQVKFTDGSARVLATGSKIGKVQIIEHASGTKEFRFNGSNTADMVVRPDGHFVSAKTSRGVEHHFDVDDMNPFEHSYGGKSWLRSTGQFDVLFKDGKLRNVNLKRPVSTVHLIEGADGVTEYRLNGTNQRDIVVNNQAHFVSAKLRGDAKVHLFDNNGQTFQTEDGVQASFSKGGTVSVKPPGGLVKSQDVGLPIDQVLVLEEKDGPKTFLFYADRDNPASQNRLAMTVPPVTNKGFWYNQPRPVPRPVPRAIPRTGGPIGQVGGGFNAGGSEAFSSAGDDRYPFWRLPFPHSPERAIIDPIAGIDDRAAPNSDMDRVTDLGIANMKFGWVVEDYLFGLDRKK